MSFHESSACERPTCWKDTGFAVEFVMTRSRDIPVARHERGGGDRDVAAP